MRFGKRQIFVLVLTLVVCVAVYINWRLTRINTDINISSASNVDKTLGEAKFVDTTTTTESEYFAQARLNKTKSREDSINLLKGISDDTKNDEESRKNALDDLRRLALNGEKEDRIESLIKAKGFKGCIVLIGDKNVSIVVQTDGLKANEAAIIKDIGVSEAGVTADKVLIIEVK